MPSLISDYKQYKRVLSDPFRPLADVSVENLDQCNATYHRLLKAADLREAFTLDHVPVDKRDVGHEIVVNHLRQNAELLRNRLTNFVNENENDLSKRASDKMEADLRKLAIYNNSKKRESSEKRSSRQLKKARKSTEKSKDDDDTEYYFAAMRIAADIEFFEAFSKEYRKLKILGSLTKISDFELVFLAMSSERKTVIRDMQMLRLMEMFQKDGHRKLMLSKKEYEHYVGQYRVIFLNFTRAITEWFVIYRKSKDVMKNAEYVELLLECRDKFDKFDDVAIRQLSNMLKVDYNMPQ